MTTETAATTTETKTTPEATIHDAIDALFADKEKAEPAATTTAEPATDVTDEATTTEAAPAEGETVADAETTTEEPAAETAAPETETEEPKKISATDYALQLARMKKRAQASSPAVTQATPSADAIKRAAAIEAAGGDAKKAFEAAGLNLADVVKAYEQEVLEGDNPDPLAVEVRRLNARIAQLEGDKIRAETTEAERNFMSVAQKFVADNAAKFPRVKALGQEALDIAKEMVLDEGARGRVLPLTDALVDVESHFRAIEEKLATTRPAQTKTTRKPSIPQQAHSAAAAPAPATTARTVSDVINAEIDALFSER